MTEMGLSTFFTLEFDLYIFNINPIPFNKPFKVPGLLKFRPHCVHIDSAAKKVNLQDCAASCVLLSSQIVFNLFPGYRYNLFPGL